MTRFNVPICRFNAYSVLFIMILVFIFDVAQCIDNKEYVGSLQIRPNKQYVQRQREKQLNLFARINNPSQNVSTSDFCVMLTLWNSGGNESETELLSVSPEIVALRFQNKQLETNKQEIYVYARNKTGRVILEANSNETFNLKPARISILIYKSASLNIFTDVIGWGYFVVWSVSFYPQIWLNFQRKSVVGLNFDFLALNILGFLSMSVFNVGLFFIERVQEIYFNKNPNETELPLALNDIVFALHALFACLITAVQSLIYERGGQRVSKIGILMIVALSLIPLITIIVEAAGKTDVVQVLYMFSYVKLIVTGIKYVPQVSLF
ncbi:hypothetical protein ACOME3_006656 [Neoechinorhynchus agilis]